MTRRRGSIDGIRTIGHDSAATSARQLMHIVLPEWHKDARCSQSDPEAFFPLKGGSTKPAKRLCNGVPGVSSACPARLKCLEFALANEERHGIWGGLSDRERRKLANQSGQGSAWTCVA